MTKSALQIILQTSIMMITWTQESRTNVHVYRLLNVVFAVLVLASSATDHHYFVASGKNVKGSNSLICFDKKYKLFLLAEHFVKITKRLKRFFINILHIAFRGFVVALLAVYLQFFIIVIMVIMILGNYIIASFVITTIDKSKNIWTSFASVLLPKCFVSRESLEGKDSDFGSKMFENFYKKNSFLFLLVFGIIGVIVADVIIRFTDINDFNCENLPFLSYIEGCSSSNFPDPILNLPLPHSWFYFLGNILIIAFSTIDVTLTYLEGYLINDLDINYV